MHQLQWGICPDQTKRSPRHFSLKCSAVRTSPHYHAAILSHHGPPKSLLSESQGPLLALMTGIMMHTIYRHAALTNRNDEGKDSLCLTFWGVLMYMRPLFKMRLLRIWKSILPCSISASTPRHSLRKVSHCGSSMSFLRQSHLQHVARVASASWASPQSMMYIGSSFVACTLASWLKRSCSSKGSSLAFASPWSVALTITPSRRDWMVSQLWLMGTWLNTSAAPLLVPFCYSNSN